VDLHFAEAKDKKIHDCAVCPAAQKAQRKCGEPGFENSKTARFRVDERGQKFTFCPGKATWYADIVKTYQECSLAFHTGILPREGHFSDQSELFVECYQAFVESYTERRYGRVWQDVSTFAEGVLKVIAKMFGGKK